MDRHDGTNARGLESAEIEAMRTQRDRAEEKARRLEAEIVEWKDAAMFVCAPVVYGGHLRPSKVREEVASLRRHLAVKREQYESRARVCDELHAELEAVRRERDEWKAKHDTLADVSRSCIATAERERDAARAEREALRRHYDEAGPEHNLLALLDLYDERRAAAESERDEALRRRTRAERVGEAVIEWASRQTAELITEYAKALERHDWKPHAELTYAIADALKEADDAE